MTKPLSDQIQDAIRAGKSEGMDDLIARAGRAAEHAVQKHAAARDRALDPLLSDEDVSAARQDMEDALFTRDRMTKAAEILREKKAEFEKAEDRARRAGIVAAADEKVARAAERLKEYPAFANRIGEILAEVAEANAAVEFARASTGLPVRDVDQVARGFNPANDTHVPILKARLPAFTPGKPDIWGLSRIGTRSGPHHTPEHPDGGAFVGAPDVVVSTSASAGAGDQRPSASAPTYLEDAA